MKAVQEDAPRPVTVPRSALEARGVTKSWSGTPVIQDVEVDLPRGTVTWLGGRNGTGKTTLLRVLAGVIDPDAGDVRIDGLHPVADRRAYQRRLGYLPAGNGALYARLTVTDNLEFWAGLGMVPRPERSARIDAALELFELGDLAKRRVDRLSMGQRQRVRIAMTFLHEPQVVLLDEPHTSLDEPAMRLLGDALERLVDNAGCALWCSPGREGIPIPAERAYVLEDRRLVVA
jgi:ABC-type multidrug transport system ATPase subunit